MRLILGDGLPRQNHTLKIVWSRRLRLGFSDVMDFTDRLRRRFALLALVALGELATASTPPPAAAPLARPFAVLVSFSAGILLIRRPAAPFQVLLVAGFGRRNDLLCL